MAAVPVIYYRYLRLAAAEEFYITSSARKGYIVPVYHQCYFRH